MSRRNELDEENNKKIVLYIKKTKNGTHRTKYGVPFQCVELIRRFFSIHKGLTFPDVVDACDFFKNVHAFTPVTANATASVSRSIVPIETYAYPYSRQPSYYLRPGSILFWKYKKPDYQYGHVALIWKTDTKNNETYVVQQNLNPPIKIYDTTVLFSKMNSGSSKFAGVKLLPREYLKGIQHLDCVVHKL
jgi:hypothetical protein